MPASFRQVNNFDTYLINRLDIDPETLIQYNYMY